MTSTDFDINALYAALDAQRQARNMSWAQVVRDINAQIGLGEPWTISTSTLTGMRKRRAIEGDGVLQMLRWLGRSPESFVPGFTDAGASPTRLPAPGPRRILRFDTKKLYIALENRRAERGLTWTQVADEIGGVGAASLTNLSKGGRTGFPQVMRIVQWLERRAADFTRGFER